MVERTVRAIRSIHTASWKTVIPYCMAMISAVTVIILMLCLSRLVGFELCPSHGIVKAL
jgi:hypothetical protein